MTESMDNENKRESKKTIDSKTPALDNFSRDLIKLAEEGKLDPVVGRDKEILRIAQILSRRCSDLIKKKEKQPHYYW